MFRKRQNGIDLFYNQSGKYIGFAGKVIVFKKELFIDTQDGTGYNELLVILKAYIDGLTNKYNFADIGYTKEDVRQHIIMRLLETARKYNPTYGATLSSFLFVSVERIIINELTSKGMEKRNPTVLKTMLYRVICKCGVKEVVAANKDEDIYEKLCDWCGDTFECATIYPINAPPKKINDKGQEYDLDFSRLNPEELFSHNSFYIPLLLGEENNTDDSAISKCDIEKWLDGEDEKTKRLVELVCLDDYSIMDAAKQVGISHMGAYNKLKRLKRKKIVREIFNRNYPNEI